MYVYAVCMIKWVDSYKQLNSIFNAVVNAEYLKKDKVSYRPPRKDILKRSPDQIDFKIDSLSNSNWKSFHFKHFRFMVSLAF